MKASPTRSALGFAASSFLFTLTSYLLLLKDPFRLERISLALNLPWLESATLHLAKLLQVNYTAPIALTISLLALFYFYRQLILEKTSFIQLLRSWPIIAGLAFLFFSFPILSNDIFDYNNSNRLIFLHQTDPWSTTADQFPQDQRIYLASWYNRTSVYPPLAHVFFALVHFFFGQALIPNIIGFKLINLLFFLTLIRLAYKISPKLTAFVALNPLLLIETLSNAHHDIIYAVFIFVSLYSFSHSSPAAAAVSWIISIFTKATSLFFAPYYFLKSKRSEQIQFYKFLTVSIITTTFISLIFKPFLGQILANLSTQSTYLLRSFPFILRHLLSLAPNLFTTDISAQLVKHFPLAIFALTNLTLMFYHRRFTLTQLCTLSLIFYLVFASAMIQPWYLLWVLPLILLLNRRFRTVLLLASFTFSLYYIVEQFSLFAYPLHPFWQYLNYLLLTAPFIILFLPKAWYTRLEKTLRL